MTRVVSAEEARGLLEGATPGPMSADANGNGNGSIWCVRDDRGVRVALLGANDGPDASLLAAAPDLAATVIALSEERDRYRAALDAIARSHRDTGACVPECSSWSEDYRINDCDCGYCEASDDAGVFAADVLDGTANLNGAHRQADADRAAAPK